MSARNKHSLGISKTFVIKSLLLNTGRSAENAEKNSVDI